MTATEANSTETRALVPRQAAEVDTAEVKALASTYLANKPSGEKAVGLFPGNMTPIQATQLARLALMYGLDPMAGELTIYEGKPLVTIDGRLRKANERAEFDGIEDPREATAEERAAWRLRDDEYMFVAAAWRKDRRLPFVGYGRAGGKYERNYLVNNNDRGPELARKRAIVNALRMAFSMPLPSLEDEANHVVSARVIDHATGEIAEGPTRATNGQIAAIHIAATKLWPDTPGVLDQGAYRERLLETCGVESSKELSEGDAAVFLDMLQREIAEKEAYADANVQTDTEIDAGVAEAKASAARRGRKVRDAITLADDDETPRERAGRAESDVGSAADSQDLAAVAAVEMGGAVQHGDDTPPASAQQKGYISRLLSDLGIDYRDIELGTLPEDFNAITVKDAADLIGLLEAQKRGGKA